MIFLFELHCIDFCLVFLEFVALRSAAQQRRANVSSHFESKMSNIGSFYQASPQPSSLCRILLPRRFIYFNQYKIFCAITCFPFFSVGHGAKKARDGHILNSNVKLLFFHSNYRKYGTKDIQLRNPSVPNGNL